MIGRTINNNRVKSYPAFVLLMAISCSQPNNITFEHHSISDPLNGIEWGTGGFTLADFDNDGDLDVTVQRRSDDDKVYWFEYQSSENWIPHFIGVGKEYQLGATAVDVNQDSFIDLVLGHVWFQNPGNLSTNGGSEWKEFYYEGDMSHENHDIIAVDVNLDNKPEIVMYNQTASTLRVYNISDPYNWTYFDIASDVNRNNVHSGIFPQGIVDLNNDNYPDAVMPLCWYKNPGNSNEKWEETEWPYEPINPNPYGLGIRVWAGDLNGDGLNDIIYSDCDVQFSKVYMLLNQNGGESWLKKELEFPKSNVGETGSFHSLQVADFDNDGDLDIFAGEQEDPDDLMKPKGLKERGIIFQNIGNSKKPQFVPIVFHEDNPGWHDALIGDVDGDGDIDIVSKVWNADQTNYHLDYWENKLK